MPESRDPTASGRLDIAGAVLAALGLAGTTYALIEAPNRAARPRSSSPAIGGVLRWSPSSSSSAAAPTRCCRWRSSRSRQFSAANAVTFVVYAALGGVFFLLVAFLQISLGYSPIAAGAASLPVTALMLLFSARAGALAQRIGAAHPAHRRPAGDRRRAC